MGVLEQVSQLKKENRSDEEIITQLRKQGVSPKDISEALNHFRIKSEVSGIQGNGDPYSPMAPPAPQNSQGNGQGYENQAGSQGQYSYAQPEGQDYNQNYQQGYQNYDNYNPQDYSQGQQQYASPAGGQEYYQQQDYGQGYDQGYGGYQQGYSQTSSDTVMEISEQVFDEKISDVLKRLSSIEEFKTISQTKLDSINDKVKRIESVMDKLQLAILDKIGSYGKDLDSIKKEMTMMQDTFTKSLDPLIEKASSKRTSSEAEEKPKRTTRKTSSKK